MTSLYIWGFIIKIIKLGVSQEIYHMEVITRFSIRVCTGLQNFHSANRRTLQRFEKGFLRNFAELSSEVLKADLQKLFERFPSRTFNAFSQELEQFLLRSFESFFLKLRELLLRNMGKLLRNLVSSPLRLRSKRKIIRSGISQKFYPH